MKNYDLSKNSTDAYNRWKPTRPTMPDMQELMNAVSTLLDAGVFYTKDIYAAVIPQFAFSEEELAREKGRVEGGVVGMEIYYARKRIEEQELEKNEADARKLIDPSPGKKLGNIKFSGMTSVLRNVHVVQVEGGIIIEGASGNRRKRFRTTCLAIKTGINRAMENKRKTSGHTELQF